MRFRPFHCVLAMGFAEVASSFAATLPTAAIGASVDESRVTKTFMVDPSSAEAADDDKHGTENAPFATLRYACLAAARAKDAGIGVKLILASGTYRETAEIPAPPSGKPDADVPLIIEAAERDQAVIDGSDTEGWTPSTWKLDNGRWTHAWPFQRARVTVHKPGFEPSTNAAFRQGDLVFVNGIPLRQVNAEADLMPGCFWGSVSRNEPGRGKDIFSARVALLPPPDTTLDGSIVQVGKRSCGLRIVQRRNVVVRGVMCQHAANPTGTGAPDDTAGLFLSGCSNVLLEDVLSQWNDGAGVLARGCSGLTLRKLRVLHNGGTGLLIESGENLLSEDSEVSFNDFRSEWAGGSFLGNSVAIKALNLRSQTWRRTRVQGNAGWGMEVNGAQDVTIEDAVMQGNACVGVEVYNCRQACLRRCLIVGTKEAKERINLPGLPNASSPAGVSLSSCADVTLESNVLAGNAARQLLVQDAENCPVQSSQHSYRHNVFGGLDATQGAWTLIEGGLNRLDTIYHRTLESDENDFWNPASAEVFAVADPGHGRAMPQTSEMSFDKWREFLAARVSAAPSFTSAQPATPEVRSHWQDPLFTDPAQGDFRVQDDSVAARWDLPSEESAATP